MTSIYLLEGVPGKWRLMYGNTDSNTYYEIYIRTTRYISIIFPDIIKKSNVIGNEI